MLGVRILRRLGSETDRITSSIRKVDIISAIVTSVQSHSLLESLFIYSYRDQYRGYMVIDKRSKAMLAIDCGDAAACKAHAAHLSKTEGASLTHLFLTHEHDNHCQGYAELLADKPGLQVFASAECGLKGTIPLQEGEIKQVGDLCVFPMSTPGHTEGSMSFVVTEVTPSSTKTPVVFTGDTLMTGSCGPVSDPKAMYDSMRKLKSLPNETLVFPGHEYALESLTFAKMLETENDFLTKKYEWVKERKAKHEMTVGTLIGEERLYNPFLRCNLPHFLQLTSETDPVRCLAKLRKLMSSLPPHIPHQYNGQ